MTTTTQEIPSISRANPASDFHNSIYLFGQHIIDQTDEYDGTNIEDCMDNPDFVLPNTPPPVFAGNNAQVATERAAYERLQKTEEANSVAYKTSRKLLQRIFENFPTELNFTGLNICRMIQLAQAHHMFAMTEAARNYIKHKCSEVSQGETLAEFFQYIRLQQNPELALPTIQVKLAMAAIDHNHGFNKAIQAYKLANLDPATWEMLSFEEFILATIPIYGETASANLCKPASSTKAQARTNQAAGRGGRGGGGAPAGQGRGQRFAPAETIALKLQPATAASQPFNNTPHGPNAPTQFCFFHGFTRTHPSYRCGHLIRDPLSTPAMKASTAPCVLADTLGHFYHSCPNIEA